MNIKAVEFDGMKIIELSHFGQAVSDQILPNTFAHCVETVNIIHFDGDEHRIVQITLTTPHKTNVNDGMSDLLLEGDITSKLGHLTVDWDKTDNSNCKPKKLYQELIHSGKQAMTKYLHSPYNHFKKHYKKVPLITTNEDDDFIKTHKLV